MSIAIKFHARTHICTHICTHARTHARTHTHTHTHTLTHTHTHTHKPLNNQKIRKHTEPSIIRLFRCLFYAFNVIQCVEHHSTSIFFSLTIIRIVFFLHVQRHSTSIFFSLTLRCPFYTFNVIRCSSCSP